MAKKSAKIAALQAELAALKSAALKEYETKLRELDETGIQLAAELDQKDRELAEFRAIAAKNSIDQVGNLDRREATAAAKEDEDFAKSLPEEAARYVTHQRTKGTSDEQYRDNPFTQALERYRERTKPETMVRVVNGRQREVAYYDHGLPYDDRGDLIR